MPKQATTADIRKGLAVLYETPRTRITRGIFIGSKDKEEEMCKTEGEGRWHVAQTSRTTGASGNMNDDNTSERAR